MAQDLQAEDNRFYRLFRQFSSESKAVSISSISLVISALALLMAWMAVYDAIHVKAQLQADERSITQSYEQLEREYRLLQLKVDDQRAALIAAGINPDLHIEGESH